MKIIKKKKNWERVYIIPWTLALKFLDKFTYIEVGVTITTFMPPIKWAVNVFFNTVNSELVRRDI